MEIKKKETVDIEMYISQSWIPPEEEDNTTGESV